MKTLNYVVPENMTYLFENADTLVTEELHDLIVQLDERGKKLRQCNGAWYPGLTESAVHHVKNAYIQQVEINTDAVNQLIDQLKSIRIPHNKY